MIIILHIIVLQLSTQYYLINNQPPTILNHFLSPTKQTNPNPNKNLNQPSVPISKMVTSSQSISTLSLNPFQHTTSFSKTTPTPVDTINGFTSPFIIPSAVLYDSTLSTSSKKIYYSSKVSVQSIVPILPINGIQ